MSMKTFVAAPVSQNERIVILDALRGIAILGILLMNIPGFGLPSGGYGDPVALGEMGTINFKVWFGIDWILEGSQRALFSILFGAGLILFVSRQERKLEGLWPADYFMRRQLWLLVFGLFNAFVLLWFWDILFHYALAGIIIFPFRRMSPKALIIAAVVCLVLQLGRDNLDLYRDKWKIEKGEAIAAMDTTVNKLTPIQKEQLAAMNGMKEKSSLEKRREKIENSKQKMTADYATLYYYQSERSFNSEVYFVYFGMFDVLLFMFLGMAFYKNGILLGQAPTRVYAWMAVLGMGLGLVLSWFRLQSYIRTEFNDFEYAKTVWFTYYELSRSVRAIGFFGIVMLLYKSGVFKWLFALMRPVGQMAFTNYLAQSFFVGLYFYGIGLAKFGELQRYQIYYVVAVVWLVEIIWSHIWLRYFRFGPLEWAWRSLTYWKVQPFKKGEPNTDTMGMV